MWTQNRLYSNSWWLITQLRKGPTWRNEHIWAAIVPCLLSSFLRLFCTVLLDCMWHAWLMRHYQKVSQANNFRRGQKSSKANKNPCILAGKQWRQTGRQAGRKVAYGAFALSLAEVVKISLILLLPCSVLDCVLVSLFTFVFMCVCVLNEKVGIPCSTLLLAEHAEPGPALAWLAFLLACLLLSISRCDLLRPFSICMKSHTRRGTHTKVHQAAAVQQWSLLYALSLSCMYACLCKFV